MTEHPLSELKALRARRQERQVWATYQTFGSLARGLRDGFLQWVEDEIQDLRKESNLIEEFAGSIAKGTVREHRAEIKKLEKQIGDAVRKIDKFIESVEKRRYSDINKALEGFTESIKPTSDIISRISTLIKALDSMADMIPQTIEARKDS